MPLLPVDYDSLEFTQPFTITFINSDKGRPVSIGEAGEEGASVVEEYPLEGKTIKTVGDLARVWEAAGKGELDLSAPLNLQLFITLAIWMGGVKKKGAHLPS